MGRPRGRPLALGAAAALLVLPVALPAATVGAAVPPAAAVAGTADRSTTIQAAPSTRPRVHNREVLVRPRGGTLQRIALRPGVDPFVVAEKLRARPDLIASAGPNVVARAAQVPTAPAAPIPTTPLTPVEQPDPAEAITNPPEGLLGWIPNDHIGTIPWTALQWNFVGDWGVGATRAWEELRARGAGRAGGKGVKIAVIDSGVASRTRGEYVASPDLPADRILPGYDFVDEDRYPDDLSGHGTHVASTIAAATDNDAGVTGLAYAASILPVRVLDEDDNGDVVAIARGIRYAVRHRADLINLSVDFELGTTGADIPEVMDAIDYARSRGVLVIASSGNDGSGQVSMPARSASVLSVGATTARGCRSKFSNAGPSLDLVAPGGGMDHGAEKGGRCRRGVDGPPIAQVTLLREGEPSKLGVPLDYFGTSMAAAHVTAVAALVRSSRVIGKDPSPDLLAAYLVRSTRELGPRGRDDRYGAGLIDAAKAVNRRTAKAAVRGAKRAVAKASRQPAGLPVR